MSGMTSMAETFGGVQKNFRYRLTIFHKRQASEFVCRIDSENHFVI